MEVDKKVFAKRLKELRTKRNIQQKNIAAKIGVHNSTLNKYESGERQPDIETISKLANIFDCTVDFLLGLSDHPRYTKQQQEDELDPELFNKLHELYKQGKLTLEDIEKINEYAEFVTRNKEKES